VSNNNNLTTCSLPPALFNTAAVIFKNRGIHPKYLLRALKYLSFEMVSAPFKAYEAINYRQILNTVELAQPPIFILGHWRSGTTHLHNTLAQSDQFAFPTIIQSRCGQKFFFFFG
jgi:hypothetical protein